MIEFPGRDPFEFCVSSGALAFDGGGWWWERPLRWLGVIDPHAFVVVAKTVTDRPRTGNLRMWHPWTCVRTLAGMGTTNAVGLTNPGIAVWMAKHLPWATRQGYRIVPSIKPETPYEAASMASLLAGHRFPFVEVNVSCPNVKDHVPADVPEILRWLRTGQNPLVLKLSADQATAAFIEAVDPHVDAYHAINSVPWDAAYPGRVSPIERYEHGLKGGVSGPAIKPHAINAVVWLNSVTAKPIIGGGGIFTLADAIDFRRAGADAVSFGTCFLHRPWRPNRIVAKFNEMRCSIATARNSRSASPTA